MNGAVKYLWLNVDPTAGVENGAISISGVEHTGRAARLFALSVQTIANDNQGGIEPAEPIVRSISGRQEGIAMFLNLNGAGMDENGSNDDLTDSEIIVSKSAGQIVLTGRTNAQSLTIAAEAIATDLTPGASVTVGEMSITPGIEDAHGTAYAGGAITITNGAPITGDYGLFGAFDFSVVLTYTANNEAIDERATITVTAANAGAIAGTDYDADEAEESIVKSFTLVQRAGDAYLYLGQDGNEESIAINLVAAGTTQSVNVLSNVSWEVVEA